MQFRLGYVYWRYIIRLRCKRSLLYYIVSRPSPVIIGGLLAAVAAAPPPLASRRRRPKLTFPKQTEIFTAGVANSRGETFQSSLVRGTKGGRESNYPQIFPWQASAPRSISICCWMADVANYRSTKTSLNFKKSTVRFLLELVITW